MYSSKSINSMNTKQYPVFLLVILACLLKANAQEKSTNLQLIAKYADSACAAIDTIQVYNKTKKQLAEAVSECIDNQTTIYLIISKLPDEKQLIKTAKSKKKQQKIDINLDKNSTEYKKAYYAIERYLMDSCKSLKNKMAINDEKHDQSVSNSPLAKKFYQLGAEASDKGDYAKAIENYEYAVKTDSLFAFAWDNLGLSYRKLGNYDKAIQAYKQSISIDPSSPTPFQNLAVVYLYKKEYQNSIETYKQLASLDSTNPEIYFGMGNVYVTYLQQYEKGLPHLCKAYNLYIAENSPYRTDAEKLIGDCFRELKKQGKESVFDSILKEYKIASK